MKLPEKGKRYLERVEDDLLDDRKRRRMLFLWLNGILALASLGMSLINLVTGEWVLMTLTLCFAGLSALNTLWSWRHEGLWVLYLIFGLESGALLTFFLITGIPDGFSALWILMIPAFSLLVFGIKGGSVYSLLTLAGLAFWLWTPLGNSLLRYPYSPTWMLRFPFLYMVIYAMALFIEFVRSRTSRRLHNLESWYRELYRHDALTGLYNRYGINEYLEAVGGETPSETFSVLVADIDDFKQVNDSYGHAAGDAVLQAVAQIIRQQTCEHCRCARWGGEEFLVVMQCSHDPMQIAERIRSRVETQPIVWEDVTLHVTVSIGVCAGFSLRSAQTGRIINAADKALYAAKRQGKNMVVRGDL